MTREEAINALKARCHYCEHFPKCVNDKTECFKSAEMAIKSLEAWDEVIKHLETTISEIQSTEMDQDCTMFCNGLTFAVAMIKNHMKED